MGAKVAPDKSFHFASTAKAPKWLASTTWRHLGTAIEVVKDFRYLGAHITTRATPTSATIDARWERPRCS